MKINVTPDLDRADTLATYIERAEAEAEREAMWNGQHEPLDGEPPDGEPPRDDYPPPEPEIDPITLPQADAVFRRWLGDSYDIDTLHAVLAAAAVQRLDGDPLWLLLLSGSGNAKTETVQALAGAGAEVVSAITSAAALLSATPRKDRTAGATGGLLRKIGDSGTLVIKDVTTILSMHRDQRAEVLAALREIHDGDWSRTVGTEGGRTLRWRGRITVIGAVTSAWDNAHGVIAQMGDRFVVIRSDSTRQRKTSGRQALRNTGQETTMRAELATAAAGVLAGTAPTADALTDDSLERLLDAGDLVTLARTNVQRDYQGNPVSADMPEAPTRYVKQLQQVVRGAVALGMTEDQGLDLALRCARDSIPPLRLAILRYLADNGLSYASDVRKELDVNRSTIERELQALDLLGLLTSDEVTYGPSSRSRWIYALADNVDLQSLSKVVQICQSIPQTPN